MGNNAIQGTSEQCGFSKFNLAVKFTGKSQIGAANLACL